MNKKFFLFPLLCLGITAFTSAQLPSSLPASDAEYIYLLREYTLNQDSSMEYHFRKEQKIITYRAFHNLYGETFIVYNPDFQKLTVNECYTVMADGKKVITPKNAFNEVLPGVASGAPPFNYLREMVITHTGLERGAEENLDYTLHTAAGNFPALMGNEVLAENEPVKSMVVRIKIPSGQRLYFKLLNCDIKPETSDSNGFTIYTFSLNDIPAISPEEFQAGALACYPRLIFSTSGSRKETFSYLSSKPAFALNISDQMKAEFKRLDETNPDKFALALKLQEKVINELHLWPVPLKFTGYRCRTPEEIWMSTGGTLAEKSVMLAAMLEAIGIEADPVAVSRAAFYSEDIGNLSDIEDFAVRLSMKEAGIQYLSVATLNPLNLGQFQSEKIFTALGHDEKPEIARSGILKEKIRMSGNLIMSSDLKITGEISLGLEDAANVYLALVRDKNKMKSMVSGGILKNDLKEIKVSQSSPEAAFQTFTVMSEKPLRRDSSWLFFSIPFCNTGIDSWGLKILSGKRTSPVEIPFLPEESYEFTINLPNGINLFSPETKTELKNETGSVERILKQEGSKVTVLRRIRLTEKIIPVEKYPNFKVLLDEWNDPKGREIILK